MMLPGGAAGGAMCPAVRAPSRSGHNWRATHFLSPLENESSFQEAAQRPNGKISCFPYFSRAPRSLAAAANNAASAAGGMGRLRTGRRRRRVYQAQRGVHAAREGVVPAPGWCNCGYRRGRPIRRPDGGGLRSVMFSGAGRRRRLRFHGFLWHSGECDQQDGPPGRRVVCVAGPRQGSGTPPPAAQVLCPPCCLAGRLQHPDLRPNRARRVPTTLAQLHAAGGP